MGKSKKLSVEQLLELLKIDKQSALAKVMVNPNVPPAPPLTISIPPPPPQEKFIFRCNVSKKVNDRLVEVGGSKWLRGKTAAIILQLFFDGQLGSVKSGSGIFDAIKKRIKMPKKEKKKIALQEYETMNNQTKLMDELKEKLKDREQKLKKDEKSDESDDNDKVDRRNN